MYIEGLVSIIVPVYNSGKYIGATLECLLQQTYSKLEIICVNDGSTDNSLKLLREYAKKDNRIKIYNQFNKGAGAARNFGLRKAKGQFCLFFDSDDLCSLELIAKTVSIAQKENADIVGFDNAKFYEDGSSVRFNGVRTEWLKEQKHTVNYRDLPNHIMSFINVVPWNKLYRTKFIRKHNLKFEEISSSNDITFSAISLAWATRVSYIKEELVAYRVGHASNITSTKSKNLNNIVIAIESVMRQAKAMPHFKAIKISVWRFVIDNYVFSCNNYIKDFDSEISISFYKTVHETFNSSFFDDITKECLNNNDLYTKYLIIKNNDYEQYKKLRSEKLIVSLTSYPERIQFIPQVLATIYDQSYPADKVVLWLAESQFPHKQDDLAEELHELVNEGKLELRWVNDVKAHKKYLYAFREFKDNLLVTIDDDLLYDKNLLKDLYFTHCLYPEAVCAVRTHLMLVDENHNFMPYNAWLKEYSGILQKPTHKLLATGGAGALYPVALFGEDLLDEGLITSISPLADDLWLKAMEIVYDIPVVLARENRPLQYVPNSQEEALWHTNVDLNQNDVQLDKICSWLTEKYGQNYLLERVTQSDNNSPKLLDLLKEYYANKIVMLQRQVSSNNRRYEQTKRSFDSYKEGTTQKLESLSSSKKDAERKIKLLESHKNVLERKLVSQRRFLKKYEARIDIQNYGFDNNSIEILELTQEGVSVKEPQWFAKNGQGIVIESYNPKLDLKIRVHHDGEFKLWLRGVDFRDVNNNSVPYWVDYTYFVVNQEVVFENTVSAWHNEPFFYCKKVKNLEEFVLHIEWNNCKEYSENQYLEAINTNNQLQDSLTEVGKKNLLLEKTIQAKTEDQLALEQKHNQLKDDIFYEKAKSSSLAKELEAKAEENLVLESLNKDCNFKLQKLKQEHQVVVGQVLTLEKAHKAKCDEISSLLIDKQNKQSVINELEEKNLSLAQDLSEVKKRFKDTSIEHKNALTSAEYKIGSVITYFPRKMKGFIVCLEEHGLVYTFKRVLEHVGFDMGIGQDKSKY